VHYTNGGGEESYGDLARKPEEMASLEDLSVDERIILKSVK
jgi:hypothetical protein